MLAHWEEVQSDPESPSEPLVVLKCDQSLSRGPQQAHLSSPDPGVAPSTTNPSSSGVRLMLWDSLTSPEKCLQENLFVEEESPSGWHTFLLQAWDSWGNSHFYGVHCLHSLSVSVDNPHFCQSSYRDTQNGMKKLIYMWGETVSDSLVTKCTNLMM